jgi:hypothetical protein
MATTLDAIVDRVSSVAATLGYFEAQTPFSFDQQPTGNLDGCFRVIGSGQNPPKGGFRFSEVRIDRVTIWVARKWAGEPRTAVRTLTRDMHSLTAAIMDDGHITSGEYAVPDDGRVHRISTEPGAEYAVLEMTVPVDYESQL